MTQLTESRVREILSGINDPNTGTDLVSSGWLRGIGIHEGNLSIELRPGYPADQYCEQLRAAIDTALQDQPGIDQVLVNCNWQVASHKVQGELSPPDGISNIIAVASAKGGVGKSTTAVNLAFALHAEGARTGILDADIYGPSMPRMLGISGKPEVTNDKRLLPMDAGGVQVMSIGFLVEEDTPMIWRGPMVTSALQQLLTETDWKPLDYLVVDLPPGTGDIQLTLAQKIPVAGAVIVTTPQDIALLDAVRGLQMFRRVEIPVLGIVENMSTHICSHCGHEEALFGQGGGADMAEQYRIPLLGQLPLDVRIRRQADQGLPLVAAEPDSEVAQKYRALALRTAGELSQQAKSRHINLPNIVIQNS